MSEGEKGTKGGERERRVCEGGEREKSVRGPVSAEPRIPMPLFIKGCSPKTVTDMR